MISRLSRNAFIDYLSNFSDDATDLIYEALKKNGIPIENTNDTYDTCAKLFESILYERADKQRNTSPKNIKHCSRLPKSIMDLDPYDKTCTVPPISIIHMQSEYLRMHPPYKDNPELLMNTQNFIKSFQSFTEKRKT